MHKAQEQVPGAVDRASMDNDRQNNPASNSGSYRWARKAEETGTIAWVVPTTSKGYPPPRSAKMGGLGIRDAVKYNTCLPPGEDVLIGPKSCGRCGGGRRESGERRKERRPRCDQKWKPRTTLSLHISASVMQHTCNPHFTDCHFFPKHLLQIFSPCMFIGSFFF